MAVSSKIGWTQATWNPWMGCHKVSSGCDNCYMFREQARFGHDPNVVRRSKTKFAEPLKWKQPTMIFTCSWSDWFIAEADEWRDEAWDVIRRTPQHTYQILTKRHGRMANHLPSDWPLPNVWLGVTTENDEWFHRRAKALCYLPGEFTRFISAEPLLGRILLGMPYLKQYDIDWVIAGGESQSGCRPVNMNWLRDIRDACIMEGVPFFLKQLGGFPNKRADDMAVLDGEVFMQMPKPKQCGLPGMNYGKNK